MPKLVLRTLGARGRDTRDSGLQGARRTLQRRIKAEERSGGSQASQLRIAGVENARIRRSKIEMGTSCFGFHR